MFVINYSYMNFERGASGSLLTVLDREYNGSYQIQFARSRSINYW